MEEIDTSAEAYECQECGLHYSDEATAQKCAEWCKKYSSCSIEITALSLERATQK